jgi:hypothetical protein
MAENKRTSLPIRGRPPSRRDFHRLSGKTHSMPTHNSLGPDDGYGVKDARTATIEPNKQGLGRPNANTVGGARAAAKH